jgi:hypothetical protein
MLVTLVLLTESGPPCPACRPSLVSNASFRDCSFIGCHAQLDGGSLYLSNGACALGLFGCLFAESATSQTGGAVYADPLLTFSLSGTSGRNCFAPFSNSFSRINIISPESGSINVIGASAAGCGGGRDTMHLAGGSSACIRSSNATRNRAADSGSALFVTRIPQLFLGFCAFTHNADANCIYFYVGVDGADATSLAVVANTCGVSRGRGVIGVASDWIAIASSVFRQNTFDCFVGTGPGGAGDVAFVRCIFDIAALSVTRGVRLMTLEDAQSSSETDPLDDETMTPSSEQTPGRSGPPSATQTPMPTGSRSVAQTPNQSPLPTPSQSAVPTASQSRAATVSRTRLPSKTRSLVASGSPRVTGSWSADACSTPSASATGNGDVSNGPTDSPSNGSSALTLWIWIWIWITIAASVVVVVIVISLVVVVRRRRGAEASKPMNETLDVESIELLPRRAGKTKR